MRLRVDRTLSSQSSDSLSRHPERRGSRILWTCFVEASVIDAHSPFPSLLFNKNRIGKPVGVVYLFDESGCQKFGDLFVYGLAPRSSKQRRRCLAGFDLGMTHSACSATSLGMPGMLIDFHAKTSRFARRKSLSLLSYLARSLVPICTILVGLAGLIPTTLVSLVRWKALEEVGPLQSGAARVIEFLSSGSSVELMMAVASS